MVELGKHIVLIGPMGVGKSTLGAALAEALGRPFLDSDMVIAAATNETGAAIAGREGVEALHRLELAALFEMARSATRSVIAPAASIVDTEAGRSLLQEHITVWLSAPADVIAARLAAGSHRRPVEPGEPAALESRRTPLFADVGSFRLDTTEPVTALVEELAGKLRRLEGPDDD